MKTPVDKADNYSFRSGTRTLSNSYNNIFLADPWESIKEHDYQSEHAKKIVSIRKMSILLLRGKRMMM